MGYGDRLLIEDLSFTLPRGGIVGVFGPNGVGKTTLFRMIVGQEQPDAGRLRIGETVRIAYVDQARAGLCPDRQVPADRAAVIDAARKVPETFHGTNQAPLLDS
ncbi:ATP-binding cassette domain-containing protein [Streptomyces chiangmaiensis]|uniref:ATP-binding cassette domain-containing protein n=1 Tax=Streptomyces chiangmaiensis TaxID=766497 RepID=UPI003CD09DE2